MARKGLEEGREEKEEYWRGHIQECGRSGSSQAEYCRRHKLSPKSYTYWKRRLREKSSVRFIPIEVKAALQPPAADTTGIVLYKEEYRIEIKEGFNPEVLGKVLRTLREL
ncbi:hypothetical protein MNBD_NITROSPIRAE03-1904 [hydrothermal vent metagenome]|uniref:Transposase n=1 Tax=hydrothermal vent metagenome TaxID=652676 RepID=A0A3B1DCG5_9ZZZZ